MSGKSSKTRGANTLKCTRCASIILNSSVALELNILLNLTERRTRIQTN